MAGQVPDLRGPAPTAGNVSVRAMRGVHVSDDIEKLLGGSRRAFDKLFESRILFLKGVLDDETTDGLIAQMLALDAEGDDPIRLYVNSPGGIITGMFALYDSMTLLKSKVDTRCVGLAASAGAFLLGTGTGNRSATENSRIMIHQPLGGARGTAKDIEIQAKNIVWMRERINEILAERTGQPLEKIQTDTDRDYWMTAREAVEYGLIDEVVEPGRGT
jgi:ATP-dependent Clp protease, protease subunit